MAGPGAEDFAPASGRLIGLLGLGCVVLVVGSDVLSPGSLPLTVVGGAVLAGVLMWSTMIRPRVWVRDGDLVMRNMLETVRIPLAAVEDLSVRQVLAVRTARRRYVSPGVGRTLRQAVRERPAADERADITRPALGPAFGGDVPSQVESGMAYGDWVEIRLRDLIQEDRSRRHVRAYSEQAQALADDVRRTPAWPEIVALVASALFFGVAVVLAFV